MRTITKSNRSMSNPARGHAAMLAAVVCMIAVVGLAMAPPSQAQTSADAPVDARDLELAALEADRQALLGQIHELRGRLATMTLEASDCARELAELRAFVTDHAQFGDDFAQYSAVKEQAEREARQRMIMSQRDRRNAERERRRAERAEARANEAKEEVDPHASYREAGFASLGLDVFAGRMAYQYRTEDQTTERVIEYDPYLGLYYRPGETKVEIDYSEMTISGSIVNVAEETRHLGVAIVFFDDRGNQVGGETVQINNARTGVPYPFTTTVAMALNRPFASSTSYVLYADPIAVPSN